MSLRPDVIAWVLVYVLWLGKQHVSAAPTSVSATDTSPISASTSTRPTQSSNPYPYGPDPSNDNSSPMTTIIIVCVVGALALIGAAWGTYRCFVTRRRSPAASVLPTTDPTPTTAIIYIPGDAPVMTAMPSLAYNSPPVQIRPDLEVTEVGPGVMIPPPPAYDVATGGRVPDCETGASLPCRPVRERTESRWKDLLVAQGRD